MPGVILVLGLIAAGVYTHSWGFYLAAGVIGFFYFLVMILIAAVAASAKDAIEKMNKTGKLR